MVFLWSPKLLQPFGVLLWYDQLNFSNHISACCSKAARQLNALARIAKYIDIRSRKIIYNSFILSNFNYCPLVWYFCGKTNNDKLQERALRILYQDLDSFDDLLEMAGRNTLLIQRLLLMTLIVFKSLNSALSERNMYQEMYARTHCETQVL